MGWELRTAFEGEEGAGAGNAIIGAGAIVFGAGFEEELGVDPSAEVGIGGAGGRITEETVRAA